MLKKVIGLILCLIMLVPVMASAHAELVSSNPKQGSAVKGPISSVDMTFGEAVKHFNSMTVKDDSGNSYAVKKYDINGEKVTVQLAKPLTDGHYTFDWKVLSADGHVAPGDLQFTVGNSSNTQTHKQNSATTTPTTKKSQGSPVTKGLIMIVVLIILVGFMRVLRRRHG